jgi:hypothetical protein
MDRRFTLNGIRKLNYQSHKFIEVMRIPRLEDGAPDSLSGRVHHIGHRLALARDDSLAHAAVAGNSATLDQTESFELRNLPAYGGVVASYPVG